MGIVWSALYIHNYCKGGKNLDPEPDSTKKLPIGSDLDQEALKWPGTCRPHIQSHQTTPCTLHRLNDKSKIIAYFRNLTSAVRLRDKKIWKVFMSSSASALSAASQSMWLPVSIMRAESKFRKILSPGFDMYVKTGIGLEQIRDSYRDERKMQY